MENCCDRKIFIIAIFSGYTLALDDGLTVYQPIFLTDLALRDVPIDALPAFLRFRLPDILMHLVFRFVPFVRDAFAHKHDEDLAAIRVLVGAVQFVPAKYIIARTQILARHAHAALEYDDGVPAFVVMLGLDVAGGKFNSHVDSPHRHVVSEDFDLHTHRQFQNGF